jgi:hypothetical protein
MVAVAHDDYVFSFGVRGRTETRAKKSEQKNVARAANPNKCNVHFLTPRPKRDRRDIRAAIDRRRVRPAKRDAGNTPEPVPPTRGSRRIDEELDRAATVPASGNLGNASVENNRRLF